MLKNAPDLQKLHYAFVMRNATVGWNMDRWKTYFGFLAEARTKAGGASYQGFINNMEKDAFANATDADRLAIEASGLRKPYKPKELPKPLGPGKDWTTSDLVAMESKLKSGRNFKNGQRASPRRGAWSAIAWAARAAPPGPTCRTSRAVLG